RDVVHIGPNSKLMQYVSMPPWGSESAMFFEVADTKQKRFEEYFDTLMGKKFLLYGSEEAIKAGLFGKRKTDEWLRYRFGTHIAISKGNYIMTYAKPGVQHRKFGARGHHGGMTKEEMEVPLIIV
ncbi:MAG: hypothetical protein ACP5MX_03425, partial [Candidatus Micrarchaeia archaeon]